MYFCMCFICYIDVILFNVFLYGASMQINDLIMIEVVLLCHLLVLALNIPHLGCDRPSDPDLLHPSVPGAHSDKNYCKNYCMFVYNSCVLHFTIACYMFCMFQCGATFTVYCILHFWCPRMAKSSCVSLCGVTVALKNY